MKIRRGDILYVDLGVQYQGSIQGSMRPVVVVSNNMANKHSTVITVVPLSTKINKKRWGRTLYTYQRKKSIKMRSQFCIHIPQMQGCTHL